MFTLLSRKMFKRTPALPEGEDKEPLLPDGPEEHPADCDGACCQTIDGATEIEDHTGMNPRTDSTQGKVAELRQELTGTGKKDKTHTAKKNALKKIVANMTMSNNDMVALFPDVINCMQIQSTEIKKM